MNETQWHWTVDGQQAGQGTLGQLASLVSAGRVGPDEQAWNEAMPTWASVRDVPALAKYLPRAPVGSPATPTSAGGAIGAVGQASDQIGYYSASGNLPPRAAEALRGHAKPTGDVGDWPLDDGRVSQLIQAARIRKKITDAANLFRALFALTLITCVCMLIGGLAALGQARGGGGAAGLAVMGAATLLAGIAALYVIAARATLRSQRWAPITMLILFSLGGLLNVVGIAAAVAGNQRDAIAGVAVNLVSVILAGLFAFTAGKAMTAIPQYLRQPAWCQEMLTRVERRK